MKVFMRNNEMKVHYMYDHLAVLANLLKMGTFLYPLLKSAKGLVQLVAKYKSKFRAVMHNMQIHQTPLAENSMKQKPLYDRVSDVVES